MLTSTLSDKRGINFQLNYSSLERHLPLSTFFVRIFLFFFVTHYFGKNFPQFFGNCWLDDEGHCANFCDSMIFEFFLFVLGVIAHSISCWAFLMYSQSIYDPTFFLCYHRSHYVKIEWRDSLQYWLCINRKSCNVVWFQCSSLYTGGGTHYNIDCVLTGRAAMWYDFNAVLCIQVFVIEPRWCHAVKILILFIRMAERAFGFQK